MKQGRYMKLLGKLFQMGKEKPKPPAVGLDCHILAGAARQDGSYGRFPAHCSCGSGGWWYKGRYCGICFWMEERCSGWLPQTLCFIHHFQDRWLCFRFSALILYPSFLLYNYRFMILYHSLGFTSLDSQMLDLFARHMIVKRGKESLTLILLVYYTLMNTLIHLEPTSYFWFILFLPLLISHLI